MAFFKLLESFSLNAIENMIEWLIEKSREGNYEL